jgi:hypothetical protein
VLKRVLAACSVVVVLFSCCTLATASSRAAADASVDGHAILVQGRAFFPVMLIDQCTTASIERARRLGINLILDGDCADLRSTRRLAMTRKGPYVVASVVHRGISGPRLVGWTYPDEPDNNGWSPLGLKQAFPVRAGTPDGLLNFVTTSGGFVSGAPFRSATPLGHFGQFARLADVAGFDLYPLNHCHPDLASVTQAQRAFARLASPAPTFQWIETGPIKPGYCGGFTMTPAQLGAETWLAIIGGARGIGFFTHTWSPAHNSFDVSPALQAAIARTCTAIKALSPGLTGRTVLAGVNSGAIQVLARRSANATYVFAVNTSSGPVRAQIHVPDLHEGAAGVFGEPRSVGVRGGRLADMFPPLGIHIYIQRS